MSSSCILVASTFWVQSMCHVFDNFVIHHSILINVIVCNMYMLLHAFFHISPHIVPWDSHISPRPSHISPTVGRADMWWLRADMRADMWKVRYEGWYVKRHVIIYLYNGDHLDLWRPCDISALSPHISPLSTYRPSVYTYQPCSSSYHTMKLRNISCPPLYKQ